MSQQQPHPDRTKSLLILLVIAAISVVATVLVVTPRIALDDPFIGLRYAANLVAGNGLVFNPGDYVEGYTAFGWIMVGALAIWLGIEPFSFWQVALVMSQLVTLWLVYQLGLRPGRSPMRALFAPALLAVHVSFVSYPMMGMSSSFITMLVTLGVLLIDRQYHRRGPAQMVWMGALFFGICLTRFDGMIIVGILMVPILWSEVVVRRDIKPTVPLLAVLGVGMLAYNWWRFEYYGDLLPNTFYTKVSNQSDELRMGANYLWNFAYKGGPFAALMVLLPLAARQATSTMRIAFCVAAFHLTYVLVVGGDWMPYFRFVLTVLPLLCFLMQEGVWSAADRDWGLSDGARRWLLRVGVVGLLAFGILPLANSWYVDAWSKPEVPGAPDTLNAWTGPFFGHDDAVTIGKHLDQVLPPDTLVCTEWAGIIPFYMRQPVFDMFGLSDKEVTSGEFPGGRMGRAITPEFLVNKRDPAVIIYCSRIYASLDWARRGVGVRAVEGEEELWIHKFFTELAEGDWGYSNCVVKIGDGYTPMLVAEDFPGRDALCFERIP